MFIIAAITGSIARSLVGFDKGGCILSAIVGFIGALIGTWLGREFDLPEIWTPVIRGIKYPIIWSIHFSAKFNFAEEKELTEAISFN
jgi:uncharacterized membrane protein YeaQ/YmgE (transglycosylase-associated protein family)